MRQRTGNIPGRFLVSVTSYAVIVVNAFGIVQILLNYQHIAEFQAFPIIIRTKKSMKRRTPTQ